jgi:plastocyanin
MAPYPALRRSEQAVILAIAVVQFLFWSGPIWRRFADWNSAIAWSYASVPVMVGALLLIKRRFHPLPWLLHTLEVAGVKFAITGSVLISVMLSQGTPVRSFADLVRPSPAATAAPTPAAAPSAPAFVFNQSAQGLDPAKATLHVGQPFRVVSTDDRLHTVQATRGNRQLFNLPVPAHGETAARSIDQAGEVELGCTVHGAAEPPVRLDIVSDRI